MRSMRLRAICTVCNWLGVVDSSQYRSTSSYKSLAGLLSTLALFSSAILPLAVSAKVMAPNVMSQPATSDRALQSRVSTPASGVVLPQAAYQGNAALGRPLAQIAGVGRLQGLVFKAAGNAVSSMPTAAVTPQFVPGRLLVAQQAGATDANFQLALSARGARSLGRITGIDVHVVEVPQGTEQSVVAALTGNASVRFAELDQLVAPAATTNDPLLASQWHLEKINARTAWDYSTGSGITIAILDTGVDGTHPDLVSKMVPGWNFYDYNSNTSDVLGHGTAVAGVAAAAANNGVGVAGVAPNARIMPIRITDSAGRARWSHAAQGLIWAADQGARVANISFQGMAASYTMQTVVGYFRSKGGVVIAAAGNSGAVDDTAVTDAMIIVSATDNQDNRTSWSSYGNFVDLTAPGLDIYSTAMGGGYRSWSGTSMSSSIVAGAAALVLARRPALSPAQVESALLGSAKDLGVAGFGIGYGYGLVNAAAAVLAATTAPAGLVASYAFSESAGSTTADTSGNNITGTLSGATWTTAGRIGNALVFNGGSALVNLGNPAVLQLTGSMTASAWIKPSVFPGDDAVIVSKRSGANVGFQLDTTIDTGIRAVGFKLTNASGAMMARYGATALQANQWYHVTGVYDAAKQNAQCLSERPA